MVEHAIMKYMLHNKAIYIKYYNYINIQYIKTNYKDIYKVLLAIDKYYTNNTEASNISYSELEATILSMYPMMKDSERQLLSTLLRLIESSSTDEYSILGYLKEHRNRAIAGELALVSFDVSEGRKSLNEIDSVYEKFELSHEQEDEDFYITDNLEELLESVSGETGLRWRLPWMNRALGSLRKGDFGFFFARPETGKTTWLASEVTHFAEQTDRPILWCNNEEGGNKVKIRCYQAALGITFQELKDNFQQNRDEFLRITGDRIKIYDDAAMTRRDIEARCKELQPSLIILDQIDKIKGFSDDRYDLQMKAIYQWARELAKRYGAVIGICQAGSTAEGKKWLTMNDVDSSHCFAKGTEVLLWGGGKKNIEDLLIGDQLIAPDNTPQEVLNIGTGTEQMYQITYTQTGESFACNENHILHLHRGIGKYTKGIEYGDILNISVKEYLNLPEIHRLKYQGKYIDYLNYPEKDLPLDPYWIGAWLGDGKKNEPEITTLEPEIKAFVKTYAESMGCTYVEHKNGDNLNLIQAKIKYKQGIKHPVINKLKDLGLFNNKHIPEIYLYSSIEQRKQLLAGLLDTDGTLAKRYDYAAFSFTNKNKDIAYGTLFLAKSLGLRATINIRDEKYYQIYISGDLNIVPTKVIRKQSSYVNRRWNGLSRISISKLEVGEYYGITLGGDHLFTLANGMIVHNTAKQGEADFIVGIGKTHDEGMGEVRFLNISKNKLIGDSDTMPDLRHGKVECLIKADIARYEEV